MRAGGRAVLVVVDDDLAIDDDGRKAGPMLAGERAQVALPGELAIDRVGVQRDVLAVPEDAIDVLAVGARRRRGQAALGVGPADLARHALCPEFLAGRGIKADQQPLVLRRRLHEETIPDDNG